MGTEGVARELDRDFLVRHPIHPDVRDLRFEGKIIFGLLGGLPQNPEWDVAVHRHLQHLLAVGYFCHHRLLRLVRERRDAVDLRLDVGPRPVQVRPAIQLHRHHPDVLRRRRQHPVDALDGLHLVLDALNDRIFHVLGRGSGVAHPHLYGVEAKLRKVFLHDGCGRQPASQEKQRHQQVCRNAVARKPINQTVH